MSDPSTAADSTTLSVTVQPRGASGSLVVVEGRLARETTPVLGDVLRSLVDGGRRTPIFRLVVDLGHAVLADDACLSPLAVVHADLAARGGRLEVRRPSRPVRRALDALGLGGCIGRPGLEVVGRLR